MAITLECNQDDDSIRSFLTSHVPNLAQIFCLKSHPLNSFSQLEVDHVIETSGAGGHDKPYLILFVHYPSLVGWISVEKLKQLNRRTRGVIRLLDLEEMKKSITIPPPSKKRKLDLSQISSLESMKQIHSDYLCDNTKKEHFSTPFHAGNGIHEVTQIGPVAFKVAFQCYHHWFVSNQAQRFLYEFKRLDLKQWSKEDLHQLSVLCDETFRTASKEQVDRLY